MFRRSRFSVRPNVGTAGRAAATPQEAPPVNQEGSETPKDICQSNAGAAAVTDNKPVVTPSEKLTAQEDGNDQTGDGTNSAAAVQRRKRFSVKPKVAPGRPSILARTPKSPVKAICETPVEVPDADPNKLTTSSQNATAVAPQGLQTPRRRRPSEESKQPKVQPKPSLIPLDSSGLSVVDATEDLAKQVHLSVDSGKQLESTSKSQIKEVTPRLPNKVPFSLPDKEATQISEKAKTLVSSKRSLSPSPAAFSLSRLLNDPSDLQRLAKAQKLRELLRDELHKEKKIKKAKLRPKEFTLDPAKMTMRDLIHYLPVSNPMTSSFEDPSPENETVAPRSQGREESPERAQKAEAPPKVASPRGEEEEEEDAIEEEQEEALMVPQVKVAEDGSLIIDEESLTVEVQRAKGPNPAQDRDPIFERGSTTTYSSFRKGTYSKPWSSEETDMFFLAISMVGTDFTMVCQLFPHRARSEIKNKFKKEERQNSWRIDKAFRERRKLDIEYFSKLLEKILEVQKSRKKLKSLTEKNSRTKNKRKAKGKKAARKLSDVEEEEESEIPDMEEEEEGEKENEELCNERNSPVSKPKKKCKRKNRQDASTEEPNDKKNKRDEKSNEQDDAHIPEDAEAALPEGHTNSDMSKKTEDLNASKDKAINPAKLSRDRAPKPLLHLGPKLGKKPPPPSTENKDATSDKGEEWVNDGVTEEQVDKVASPVRQGNKGKSASDDFSSEEENANIQPLKPTRYGRMPKPTKPLTYSPKNDTHSSASETTPASPAGSTASAAGHKPKCTAKRKRSSKPQSVQESKKSKLVTLRASHTEDSDDEDKEKQWEVEEGLHSRSGSSRDNIAAAFVPASLRFPDPLIVEVEETMEELDILANMPDVLGISQDALCPDVTRKLAQNETGPAEPCEHQLDLLVDVIDCVSSECTVSEDESYNEAAHTLLTIGSLAHNSQFAQKPTAIRDQTTGTTSVSPDETSQNLEKDIETKPPAKEEKSDTSLMSETSAQGVEEPSETTATMELENSKTNYGSMPVTVTSNQRPVTGPQLQSSPEKSENIAPQTRRGRIPKLKPKPNLGQASRSVLPKSQPETSTKTNAIEAPTVSAILSQTSPKADCSRKQSSEISFIEVKLPEETFGAQERAVDQLTSGAVTLDQSPCLFDTTSEPATQESTDKILMSEVGTSKDSCNYPVRSDTAVTELQRTKIDSAPVEQNSSHPVSSATSVKDEPVSQKEESGDTSHQIRKSGFQKVKPKPNLTKISRIAHSKSQTTEETEKNSNLIPNQCPMSNERPIVAVEAEDTAPVQESSEHCAPRIIPASQKEGSALIPTRPTVRFQKVKPKPNVALTPRPMRSKPTTVPDTIEENRTLNPEIQKKITDVEAEPPLITSSEKTNPSTGPASDLIPSFDVSPTHTTTEKLSTAEDKEIDVRVVGQVESSTEPSGQNTSENQNFSKAQFEPSREQTTRVTSPTSESKEEKLMSHVGTIESNCSNLLTSVSEIPENIVSAPIEESISLVKELPVSPTEESEVVSTCHTGRGRKVKPKPNLHQTSIAMPSKRQTTKDPVTHEQLGDEPSSPTSRPVSSDNLVAETEVQPTCSTTSLAISSQIKTTGTASPLPPLLEFCSTNKPAEELPSIEDQKTNIESSHISSSEGSENKVPQRRRRFSKMKPNLGSSTRNKTANDCSKPSEVFHIDTSNATSERQPVNSNDAQTQLQPTEKDGKHLTSLERSLHTELRTSTKLASAESEMSVDGRNDKGSSLVSENRLVLTESVVENKNREKPTVEGESEGDMVAAGLASQWDCKQDTPVRVPETNTQSTDDPTAILIVQSSEEGSSESKMKHGDTLSISDPKESTQQLCLEDASEVQIQDAVQQSSETTAEANPAAAQSTQDNKLEPTNSSEFSRKALQTRRGRLVKPKPNLGPSSRPKQIQNITQAEAGKPVSEGQADIQEPVEGAIEQRGCLTQVIEQMNQHDSPPDVAASSLACLTQVADNYTHSQDESSPSTDGNQGQPNLTLLSDMPLENVPSDPDEPFFILSLTEIPVCSMGEPVNSTSEPLSCLPVAHASVEQESVSGEGLAAAEDGPLSNVAMPVSTGETCEMGLVDVKDIVPDQAACKGAIMENPVDPPESTTIQPSILPKTVEINEEAERPPTRPKSSQRIAAKQQSKPKTPRKTQATKALPAKETESTPTQTSEPPGTPLEPKFLDEVLPHSKKGSGDHVDIKKSILMEGEDPADRNIGAQTRTTSGCGKPKGSNSSSEMKSTALLSYSKGRKVKTPSTVGKRSTPAPGASTSYDAPKPTRTQLSEETLLMPSTTLPTAEVDMEQNSKHSQIFSNPTHGTSPSTAEQSDSLDISLHEEEPTNVSQYFLSDIFTEVEEE